MSEWSGWRGGGLEVIADATGGIAGSATANQKSAWTELTAATPFDLHGFLIQTGECNPTATYLVDIGIGPSGSEVVLWPDLLMGANGQMSLNVTWVPLFIPAGTRIAARVQSSTGDSTDKARWRILGGRSPFPFPVPLCSRVIAYGADTADSGGTTVDPGATANTKGAWYEVTAATTAETKVLYLALGTRGNSAMADGWGEVDIAVGAAGSEQVIFTEQRIRLRATEDIFPPLVGPIPVSIPAGTRLAVRAQCSITDATDRLFDVALYGLG